MLVSVNQADDGPEGVITDDKGEKGGRITRLLPEFDKNTVKTLKWLITYIVSNIYNSNRYHVT